MGAVEAAEDDRDGLPSEALGAIGNGKYRLFASLGRGGMADVLLAVAHGPMGFNKLVVVKKLRANLGDDPTCVAMFLDEARLAARLSHPNVVHTYEVGEQAGVYFIAMEYLEGQPLHKIRKSAAHHDKQVRPNLWARIVGDALNGLHYAHELANYDGTKLNVIHRDVSPQNIFVNYNGVVKLVDFGIAKAGLNSSETETGVLKGKVAYMAPEQAMGHEVDRRADIFAMGVVFWELLTNKRLVTGDAAAALHKILHMPFPLVTSEAPDVPLELEAIVMKAIERDPQKRFQTAHEMRQAIESFLKRVGEHPGEDEVGELVTSLFSQHRAEVQLRIQKHMARKELSSLPDLSMMSGSHPSITGSNRPAATTTGTMAAVPEPIAGDPSVHSAVQRSPVAKSRVPIIVALMAVVGAGLAVAIFFLTRPGTTTQAAAPPVVSVAPPPSTVAGPAKVRVRIMAKPEAASVFLDGVLLTNPYVGTFPQDGSEHEIHASAPGFVPETRKILFDANSTHEMSLYPEPPGTASSAAAPVPSASASADKPHHYYYPGPSHAATAATTTSDESTANPNGRQKVQRPNLDNNKDIWK